MRVLERSGSDLCRMGSFVALRVQEELWRALLGGRNLTSLVEKNRKEGVHQGITAERWMEPVCCWLSEGFSVSVMAAGLPPLF